MDRDTEMMRQCYPNLYGNVYDDGAPEQDPYERADAIYDAIKNGDYDE